MTDLPVAGNATAAEAAASAEAPAQPVARPRVVAAQAVGRIPLFNRELSWLEFNWRVLAEARDESVPLLERLKFLAITANNLDEFQMVRVGGIRALAKAGIESKNDEGNSPKQELESIRRRIGEFLDDQQRCLAELLPRLEQHGIRIEPLSAFAVNERQYFRDQFDMKIAPVLTPLAFDPGHPFPFLANLSLNLAVVLETARGDEHVAFIKVPPTLPRFLELPEGRRFVAIEALITEHAATFFPGLRVRSVTPFRVIRNADLAIREDEVQDLLQSVESELRRRDRKEVVTVEIMASADESLVSLLSRALEVAREEILSVNRLLKLGDLMQIYGAVREPALLDPAFNPRIPAQLATSEDIFAIFRREDILLHRPYESFSTVVEFVQTAATDPDVLAIKMTLYRTDEGSPIIEALLAAAIAGKQVTAVVELQARFDEQKNITWARRLENAGVQVVYGLVGIKTHCKLCLVVRREEGALRRYVHLSTGNYNAKTARIYTDIDLFTADDAFGRDAAQLMNLLTGFSIGSVQEIFEQQVPELDWKRFIVSPIGYQGFVLDQIRQQTEAARAKKQSRIVAKLNALVDPAVIEALYEASRAGVKIDLIVRGICCLVPRLPGYSENIRVLSVVDKFLEHSRVFLFEIDGVSRAYVSSGDWMPRNFFRRVEVTFPILSEALKKRVASEILGTMLADNVKGWRLESDGTYRRRKAGDKPALRSQDRFIEITRSESVRVGPYEEILARPGTARRKAKRHKKKTR